MKVEIIHLADELVRKKGYNAFSYTDISVPLGIRNAAIHYYFPSKSDLGEAVVEAELQRFAGYRQEAVGLPGDELLKALFGTFYQNSQHHLICLMGSLTPDYDTFGAPLRQKVEEMCAVALDSVTVSLEKAREEGRLQYAGTAADRGLLVMGALSSSLLLSRVLGETIFERMLDQLLQDMGAVWRIKDLKSPE